MGRKKGENEKPPSVEHATNVTVYLGPGYEDHAKVMRVFCEAKKIHQSTFFRELLLKWLNDEGYLEKNGGVNSKKLAKLLQSVAIPDETRLSISSVTK